MRQRVNFAGELQKTFPLAHIALAVSSLDDAAALYQTLGFTLADPEIIEREKVRARVACKDNLCVELLEAHPPGEGPIARFIEKRGQGMHHIALRSANLDSDLKALAEIGIAALKGYPASGLGGSRVAFLDPKTTAGTLIELVQSPEA